ncbi:hypothetical protein [Chitinimonas lacunae]|uniref:Uncharacterized protein n=1 Tax=Chitinimonas lacunae TaxID=1963018 RepID=A0ABV8MJD0_9NEIS
MSRAQDAWEIMTQTRNRLIAAGTTDPHEIARAIDAAYPFGERCYWPYKAWLSARRKFFTIHGLPLRAQKRQPTGDLVDTAEEATDGPPAH